MADDTTPQNPPVTPDPTASMSDDTTLKPAVKREIPMEVAPAEPPRAGSEWQKIVTAEPKTLSSQEVISQTTSQVSDTVHTLVFTSAFASMFKYLGIAAVILASMAVIAFAGFKIYAVFQPKPEPPLQNIPLTDALLREFGLVPSLIIAEGGGKLFDIPSSVGAGLQAGNTNIVFENNGIEASLFAGKAPASYTSLPQYAEALKALKNAYDTDIQAFLDQSIDRRKAFEDYLKSFQDAEVAAKEQQKLLLTERDNLKVYLNQSNSQKTQLEADFFTNLDKLDGVTAESILNDFIDASKVYVDVKAQVVALERLNGFYNNAFQQVSSRLKALQLNQEALIQGIKVFDVPGSQLELIIRDIK